MCINKIHILNKGYRDVLLHTSRYVDVPCGHCWQCSLNRVNSVTYRILQDVTKFECPSCFVTLSYSDLFLPKLVYLDSGDHEKEISCWNREHIKRFFKRVRRKLHYFFGISSHSFKYFLSCERGGHQSYLSDAGEWRIATDRVHYHLFCYLLADISLSPCRPLPVDFLNSDFMLLEDCSLLEKFWHYLLDKEWYYGNVDLKYLFRDLVSSVKYVCKYICKDISEPLFKIPKDKILCLKDPEFDIKSALWFIQSKPFFKDSFDTSSSNSVVYTYHGVEYSPDVHRKRHPRAISYSSLLPRCMGSINIGMSFFDDLSYEESIDFFLGKKKVCLPSVKSSILINLPSYYFNKISHFQKFIPHGKKYLRTNVYLHNELVMFPAADNSYKVRVDWNNVQGLFVNSVPSSTSQSVHSSLGDYVKRYKFKNYVSNTKASVLYYLSSFELVWNSLRWYRSLPLSYHTSYFDAIFNLCEPYASESLSISPSEISFKSVARALLVSDVEKVLQSDRGLFCLYCLIKLVELCKFHRSTLVHLANDKIFADSFYSACRDNPDLFISHSY